MRRAKAKINYNLLKIIAITLISTVFLYGLLRTFNLGLQFVNVLFPKEGRLDPTYKNIDGSYFTREAKIYYVWEAAECLMCGAKLNYRELETADPMSFKVFSANFASDKNHNYSAFVPITLTLPNGATLEKFEFVSVLFDEREDIKQINSNRKLVLIKANEIYYFVKDFISTDDEENQLFEVPQIDPDSFMRKSGRSPLTKDGYVPVFYFVGEDATNYYIYSMDQELVIQNKKDLNDIVIVG